MAIAITCSCGKVCRAKDEAAGKRVRCPKCGNLLDVPSADDAALDALLAAPAGAERDEPAFDPPTASAPPPPMRAPERRQRPASWTGSTAAATSTTFAAPAAPARRPPRVVFEEGWFGSVNSGMIGGLLMIIIAGVWFVAGLAADRIYFYPPVLAVIGLISIFRGMAGGE